MFVEDFYLLRWECVRFVSMEDALQIIPELKKTDLKVIEIHANTVKTSNDLFILIAKAMNFPNYFGKNWDALADCLRDMSWMPAKGYILFVYNAEQFWKDFPHTAGHFVQIWSFSAEYWAKHKTPFRLMFVWDRKYGEE